MAGFFRLSSALQVPPAKPPSPGRLTPLLVALLLRNRRAVVFAAFLLAASCRVAEGDQRDAAPIEAEVDWARAQTGAGGASAPARPARHPVVTGPAAAADTSAP